MKENSYNDQVTSELLTKLNQAVPRYTSYPTAPEWVAATSNDYLSFMKEIDPITQNVSLYIHIPFCTKMCLYCGCSVVLNRKADKQEIYVSYLLQELHLFAVKVPARLHVTQIHFGGGTPTALTNEQFHQIFSTLHQLFNISTTAEISIEIDPRTVYSDQGEKLRFLKTLGFNRVSFGVQDLDPKVQEAVKRNQSEEMSRITYERARALNFDGINIDLIYGLPHQTVASFTYTAEQIAAWRPDRIALFSYAKVPWLKPHQKAIKESALPTTNAKFEIYLEARKAFLNANYTAIGMDHFGLPEDSLTQAFRNKTLHRNFQGYTLSLAEHLIGFGMTAIGSVGGAYFQNAKTLESYYSSLDQKQFPIARGRELSEDDVIRQWVIQKLMCQFELVKEDFKDRFNLSFDTYFHEEQEKLFHFTEDKLVTNCKNRIGITSLGALFVRNIAAVFDPYFQKKNEGIQFSQSI